MATKAIATGRSTSLFDAHWGTAAVWERHFLGDIESSHFRPVSQLREAIPTIILLHYLPEIRPLPKYPLQIRETEASELFS